MERSNAAKVNRLVPGLTNSSAPAPLSASSDSTSKSYLRLGDPYSFDTDIRHGIIFPQEDFSLPQEGQQSQRSIEHVEIAVGISRNLNQLNAIGAALAS